MIKKNDFPKIIRYAFSLYIILTTIRKIIYPEFKNYFMNNLLSVFPVFEYELDCLWKLLITIEIIIAIGIYFKFSFNISVLLGFLFLISGLIVSILVLYFQIESNCGCGLLGNNAYLIIAQKIILLLMLEYIRKNREVFIYNLS